MQNIAMSTPTMTTIFCTKLTRTLVKVIEIALVSLVTRVTSLPTGIAWSCAWDSDSMWRKRSSRSEETIF